MGEWIYWATVGPVVDYLGWWTLPVYVIASVPFAVLCGKALKGMSDDYGDE